MTRRPASGYTASLREAAAMFKRGDPEPLQVPGTHYREALKYGEPHVHRSRSKVAINVPAGHTPKGESVWYCFWCYDTLYYLKVMRLEEFEATTHRDLTHGPGG